MFILWFSNESTLTHLNNGTFFPSITSYLFPVFHKNAIFLRVGLIKCKDLHLFAQPYHTCKGFSISVLLIFISLHSLCLWKKPIDNTEFISWVVFMLLHHCYSFTYSILSAFEQLMTDYLLLVSRFWKPTTYGS